MTQNNLGDGCWRLFLSETSLSQIDSSLWWFSKNFHQIDFVSIIKSSRYRCHQYRWWQTQLTCGEKLCSDQYFHHNFVIQYDSYFIIFYFRMNIVLNLCLIASVSCFNTGYNDQSVSNILNKPECQIAHQSLLSTLALVSKNNFHGIYKFIIDHTMVQFRKTPSESIRDGEGSLS